MCRVTLTSSTAAPATVTEEVPKTTDRKIGKGRNRRSTPPNFASRETCQREM